MGKIIIYYSAPQHRLLSAFLTCSPPDSRLNSTCTKSNVTKSWSVETCESSWCRWNPWSCITKRTRRLTTRTRCIRASLPPLRMATVSSKLCRWIEKCSFTSDQNRKHIECSHHFYRQRHTDSQPDWKTVSKLTRQTFQTDSSWLSR